MRFNEGGMDRLGLGLGLESGLESGVELLIELGSKLESEGWRVRGLEA